MSKSGSWTSGQPSTATAATRPPQPATIVRGVTVAGRPPHGGLEHASAVERQARDQVEHADQEVGAGQALDRDPRAARRA